ncbi:MAG: HAMP domain-containing protein [Blastocatellia bacterium]|nr:HAMP domain-containing protein [Blastocatellia bacterium]
MKLHTKTTLLTSAITIAVLVFSLIVISQQTAELLRREQRVRSELQAVNFAEQISRLKMPHDPDQLAQAAKYVQRVRVGVISVAVWERVGGTFVRVAVAGDAPSETIPEETVQALRGGLPSRTVQPRPPGTNASIYRVFAPVVSNGRLSGAVELVDQLEDAPSVAVQLEKMAVLMAAIAVLLITLATYQLFRQLVYQPIERLLDATASVKAGNFNLEVAARNDDELGVLTYDFNQMIKRLKVMTEEREKQKLILQEQVREATLELQDRNRQLEFANLELWNTTRRLSELERLAATGQMAAQFAHEVGTPLNLISGHVQLLRATPSSDPKTKQRLETISVQIERIERIVRQMLDRTRTDFGTFTPLDMNALLLRIFEVIAPTLESHNVKLETTLASDLPEIHGNADRLQQVFFNLINNALDAMPHSGTLQITTSVSQTSDGTTPMVRISIHDSGVGMTEEVRSRIFDPLYTTKEIGRGTGLGLVIVRQVIREHQGEIEVESVPGAGTRFILWLPIPPKD